MKEKIQQAYKELEAILSEGNVLDVDKFEEVFSELLISNTVSSTPYYYNKYLIRNAFIVTVSIYGKEASILKLKKIINSNGEKKELVIFSKNNIEPYMSEVYSWFMNDYYYHSTTYQYCIEVRYLVDKMLSLKRTENFS